MPARLPTRLMRRVSRLGPVPSACPMPTSEEGKLAHVADSARACVHSEMGSVGQELLLVTSWFALFNPPAAIAPFVAVAGRFPADVQHRMALRIATYYAVALVGAALIGHPLLG